jgi:hypothetical protein
VNPAPGRGPELASLLEQAARALGASHPELKHTLSEAVAEVRYLQLASAGPAPGAVASSHAVPLLVPRGEAFAEEAALQVHRHLASPEVPEGVTRLDLVLPTEHLATVQASLVEAGGRLTLTLGLADAELRAFVEERLEGLREALAARGHEAAHLTTRLASAPAPSGPPALEGVEVLRFDRRV